MTLKWTREPPKEAGKFYWQRDGRWHDPHVSKALAGSYGIMVGGRYVTGIYAPEDTGWWAGPIPEPEEPDAT